MIADLRKMAREIVARRTENVFCATGKGGGRDPTCGKVSQKGLSKLMEVAAMRPFVPPIEFGIESNVSDFKPPVFVSKERKQKAVDIQALESVGDIDNIKVSEVARYLAGKESQPVSVTKYRGVHFLTDGHHRVAAAIMKGDSNIRADVMDLDEMSQNSQQSRTRTIALDILSRRDSTWERWGAFLGNAGANCGIGKGGFQKGNKCAAGGGGGSEPPSKHVASKAEHQAALRKAKRKIKNAPVPSKEAVAKARKELRNAREGKGRAGGESRGGSAKSRRRQRENLFKEFGGEEKGYVVCPWTGLKMHHTDDPKLNPNGYPKFERGKIFVKCQGGGYQLPNLIPESFAANRSRNDTRLKRANSRGC